MMVAPCPHCMGRKLGIAETIQGEIGFQMTCLGCHADGPRGDTEEEAKVLWNGRRVSLEGEAVVKAAKALAKKMPSRDGWRYLPNEAATLYIAVRKLMEAQG